MNFVTLHNKGKPRYINLDNIVGVFRSDDGKTTITPNTGFIIPVDEDYEDVVRLIDERARRAS